MERDRNQCIKTFAFSDSAAGKGALPEEKRMRSYCSRAGRPTCSWRIESRLSGGYKNGCIKIRSRGGEPLECDVEMII